MSPSSTILATNATNTEIKLKCSIFSIQRPLEEPSYSGNVNDQAKIQHEDTLCGEGGRYHTRRWDPHVGTNRSSEA
jgi:hypothetical protein